MIIGIDRNVGNVVTPERVIKLPEKVIRRMASAESTARRVQRTMGRRQKSDGANRKPGSRRWAKAAKRYARKKRRAANIRKAVAHKISGVVVDNNTHAVFEKLEIKNTTKYAKDTAEQPGRNGRQKAGLNRTILEQCWGLPVALLSYQLAGGIIYTPAAYTCQARSACGFTDKLNRADREFLCLLCYHTMHADRNAARDRGHQHPQAGAAVQARQHHHIIPYHGSGNDRRKRPC